LIERGEAVATFVAPAICNVILKATGRHVRSLPLARQLFA
jgi:CO/xanthine dehydrogenase Mo-binding subunit